MSAFLGPIHYWLYNKIHLVIEREQMIYDKAVDLCHSTAEEIRAQVWQVYGEPLPEVDLGELIDHENIHGWLQRRINLAESREAAFVKELLDMCRENAQQVVKEVFYQHGLQCGGHAKQKNSYNVIEATGIYKALQDYYLNGMPCDQNDTLVENTEEKLVWVNNGSIQEVNWKRAGAELKSMKEFYYTWLVGFVEGLNPQFKLVQTADTVKGDRMNRYEISKQA